MDEQSTASIEDAKPQNSWYAELEAKLADSGSRNAVAPTSKDYRPSTGYDLSTRPFRIVTGFIVVVAVLGLSLALKHWFHY